MQHQDTISEAMEAFLKQLPNPKYTNMPSIHSEVVLEGQKTKFVAQKVKGRHGITWKVYPIKEREKKNIR